MDEVRMSSGMQTTDEQGASMLELMPWAVVADVVFGELDPATVIALATSCRAVKEAVWLDQGFWHRQFTRCFGEYLPQHLICWRSAFFNTHAIGLQGGGEVQPQQHERRGLLAKVKATVEKKVMAMISQQQQTTEQQAGWGTILIGVLGVRGSGKSRMLRQVQSWRGLVLHPLKCKGGCCCKQDASQRRYTVSARVMDLPQDGVALGHFLAGIYTLCFVVNTVCPEWELEQVQAAIVDTFPKLPANHKSGVPVPIAIVATTTGEAGRKRSLYEIVDKLGIAHIASKINRSVAWRCFSVSTGSGDGLLETLQWVGDAYSSYLTIRND